MFKQLDYPTTTEARVVLRTKGRKLSANGFFRRSSLRDSADLATSCGSDCGMVRSRDLVNHSETGHNSSNEAHSKQQTSSEM
jgi:hypothetical protein